MLYIVTSKMRLDGSGNRQKKMAPGLQKRLGEPPKRIRVVSAVGVFGQVVSAKFWGESIQPMLVGRFGRESFRPRVVSAQEVEGGRGTLNFSAYVSPSPPTDVGSDPASTVYPI